MEKFIVSARKYRPHNFSSVIGQDHITTTLKNAINNNQLAHAFLFCGPRGVGKTTCARILAKTINCENRTPEGEACNECNSCVSFDQGTSLNIHELDAASNNSVDDIRSLVEQVRFAPQAGRYKVYIVDEVHMLSASAFNAFLKTLEEPPPYAIFILATTEKHKILPTILSRCQIFDFKRIDNKDTVNHLLDICKKEEIKAERAALHVIAQKSEGCLRDSLSILDKIVSFTNGELTYKNTLEHLNILDEDYYFQMIDHMQKQNLSDALLMFDEINRKGFEGDMVLNGFAEFIRNILVSNNPKVAALLEVAEDFKPKYTQAAKSISPAWLIAALNLLNDAEINFKQARNKRLHVELTIIKLCYLHQAIEIVDNQGESTIKKKRLDTVKPVAFRAIPILSIPANPDSYVDRKKESSKTRSGEAKLIIETEGEKNSQSILPEPVKETTVISQSAPKTATRIGKLDKIRQQAAEQQGTAKPATELNIEELHMAWGQYIDKLIERKNPSAASNFKSAKLEIIDSNTISIITGGNMQQKFIEGERAGLIEHLQLYFNNRSLFYQLSVVEDTNAATVERPLSSQEKYLRLIEEYPIIKELKDKLKLSLDY